MLLNYEVKINIETLEVFPGLFAFKKDIYRNNELYKSIEAIATKEDMDRINNYGEFKISNFALYPKKLMELHLFHDCGKEFDELLTSKTITNPYTFLAALEGRWEDNYVLARYLPCSDEFAAPDGSMFPKGIKFDYSNRICEGEFDLEALLLNIKSNKNVICLSDKIETVPYYNSDEGCTQFIKFIVCPSFEEEQKMKGMNFYQREQEALRFAGLLEYKL